MAAALAQAAFERHNMTTKTPPSSTRPKGSSSQRSSKLQKYAAYKKMARKGLRRLKYRIFVPKRRGVRIFGVGAAKTGTHSLGQMFEERVHARHEVDSEELIALHLERETTGKNDKLRAALKQRDRKRCLKVDASQVNVYLLEDLEALFEDSRYVLTIRSPVLWLRSIVDDSLRRDTTDTWKRFREYRFGQRTEYPDEEQELAERGLFTLAGYLTYWRSAIERVEKSVPKERLLVVSTKDLGPRSAEIAEFCGIPGGGVPTEKAKAFVNTTRFGVLSKIPRDYLEQTIERICGKKARAYLPESSISEEIDKITS